MLIENFLIIKAYESLSIINAFYKTLYLIFGCISSLCNRFLLFETVMINDNYKENSEKFKKSNQCLDINNYQNYINSCKCRLDGSNINFKVLNYNLGYHSNLISKTNKENSNCINKSNNIKVKDKEIGSSLNIIKKEIGKENKDSKDFSKKIDDIIEYNRNTTYKFSTILKYKLLFIHCFHCLLTKKNKILFSINSAKMKIFKKKLDIHNYLNLQNKLNLLFMQIKKEKMINNNVVQSLN